MAGKLTVRTANIQDIPEILSVEEEAWSESLRASKEQLASRIKTFPQGSLVALMDETIIGVTFTQIIDSRILKRPDSELSWEKITDHGFIKKTHNPKGDTLYGVDLSVSEFSLKASVLLMEAIGKVIISLGLKQGMLGGRIPRYHKYSNLITPQEYIKLERGKPGQKIKPDPELIFYRRCGAVPIKVIQEYIQDPESCNNGVLLLWKNPFYKWPFPRAIKHIFKIK